MLARDIYLPLLASGVRNPDDLTSDLPPKVPMSYLSRVTWGGLSATRTAFALHMEDQGRTRLVAAFETPQAIEAIRLLAAWHYQVWKQDIPSESLVFDVYPGFGLPLTESWFGWLQERPDTTWEQWRQAVWVATDQRRPEEVDMALRGIRRYFRAVGMDITEPAETRARVEIPSSWEAQLPRALEGLNAKTKPVYVSHLRKLVRLCEQQGVSLDNFAMVERVSHVNGNVRSAWYRLWPFLRGGAPQSAGGPDPQISPLPRLGVESATQSSAEMAPPPEMRADPNELFQPMLPVPDGWVAPATQGALPKLSAMGLTDLPLEQRVELQRLADAADARWRDRFAKP